MIFKKHPDVFSTPETSVVAKPPRVVLLPTVAGFGWGVAALGMLVTAINYGNNFIFALAFLLLSIWLASGRECRRNLIGLQWLPAPEAAAFAGENLCLSGTLRDTAGRARAPIMLCAGKRTGCAVVRTGHAGVWSEAQARLELTLPVNKRGRQRIDGLHLVSLHPLGLWSARRSVPDMTALVYPRPAGERPLPGHAPNPAHRQQAAGDFQGLRAFAPGDAPRRVNWRVYARREELMVNNFDGGAGGQALWFDLAACEGDLETRLSQLSQWICEAERQGREYGLRGLRSACLDAGQDRPPGRGRAHQRACLAQLSGIRNQESEK